MGEALDLTFICDHDTNMHSTRSTRQRRRLESSADLQAPDTPMDPRRGQDSDPDALKASDRPSERDIWESFREEHIDCIQSLPDLIRFLILYRP